MDHEQNDLLISAYLDGELNADERAHVEQLLATSAGARQLVEELKAIRAGLQSLPQHRLPTDFAQEVLRRAEQEQKVSQPAAIEIPTAPTLRPSVLRSWRGIGWSIAALAAAVIILVATRHDEQADRQVARSEVKSRMSNSEAILAQPSKEKVAQQFVEDRLQKQLQPAADQEVQLRSAVGGGVGAAASDGAAPASAEEVSNLAAAEQPQSIDSEPVLVVQVGLKQAPAAGNEFEQVLAKNRIVMDSDQDQETGKMLRDESGKRRDNPNSEAIAQKLTHALEQDALSRYGNRTGGLDKKQEESAHRAKSPSGVDVFYVEASPEQVQSVLQDLGKSASIVSLGFSSAPQISSSAPRSVELKQSRESNGTNIPLGRAQRVPAVRDWVSKNVDNLPETIIFEKKDRAAINKPVPAPMAAPATAAPSSPSLAVDKSQSQPPESPPAEAAASSTTGALSVNGTPTQPLQRALFVLRSVAQSDAAKPSIAVPSAQPGATQSDAPAQQPER